MSDPIISLDNLSVELNGINIIEAISLVINSGEIIGIVGPNGAGKSTLIRAILNLVPYSGEITLWGQSHQEFNQWSHIGYLPQSIMQYSGNFPATVEELVSLGLLSSLSWPRTLTQENKTSITNILQSLEISHIAKKSIHQLSGGQKQRVWLAKALVSQPKLLILDEPTNALDPEIKLSFYEQITEIHQKHGTTILLISHNTEDIGNYAQKLLVINQKIIFWGNFKTFCKSPEMSHYFGISSQHIICHQHR
jgi:zinc transport system ATP-binding protein